MRFSKKFLLALVVPFWLGSQASALSYDFNVGLGIGIQVPPLYIAEKDDSFTQTAFSWTPIGGFVGAGLSFGESFVSSVGLEYTGYWQMNNRKTSMTGSPDEILTFNNFYQFADIYYKAGILSGALPVDVQLNLGLAIQNVVNIHAKFGDLSDTMDVNAIGLGFHVGLRANVHMFFLGLDYSFVPSYSLEDGSHETASNMPFNSSIFGVTVGVIFNKGILDSFLGN
jgi:hypothetical protein